MTEAIDTPCRLLIACTNVLESAGIRSVLSTQAQIMIVGEVATPQAAMEAIRRELPCILLIDIDDFGWQALSLLRDVFALDKNLHVILLSALESGELVKAAMDLGVRSVVLKVQPMQLFTRELHAHREHVSLGNLPARPRQLTERLQSAPLTEDNVARIRIQSLTEREREIIDYVGKGLSNKEIADRLQISFITVRHHLSRIFSKLGTENRQKLLLFAYAYQLIDRGMVPREIVSPPRR